MKYLKFTYVDALTGVSVASQPAANGPVFPEIAGLTFVWARESRYPTDVPEFFGTCPDSSSTQVDGVLAVVPQGDWEVMRADEMAARVPGSVSMRQARLALEQSDKLDAVDAAIEAMPGKPGKLARIEWEYAQEVRRDSPLVAALAPVLGMAPEQIDGLFVAAAGL